MDYLLFFGIITTFCCAGLRELLAPRSWGWVERAYELAAGGNEDGAMRWTTAALWVAPGPARFAAQFLRMQIFADRGETARAIALAHRLIGQIRQARLAACPWQVVNGVAVTFINGGRYAAALNAVRSWAKEQQQPETAEDERYSVLARINEAEALCNCARIDEALATLKEVEVPAREWPLAIAGLTLLRAWIQLQAGRAEDARETLTDIDLTALDPAYTPEVEYTRAALERDSGQLDVALDHAERGLAAAKRASSRRNGQFMLASIAALRGDHDGAHRLYEEGAQARYRAQAGEGLNRYARFLESVGDSEKASRVRERITERDPEWRDPIAATGGEREPGTSRTA